MDLIIALNIHKYIYIYGNGNLEKELKEAWVKERGGGGLRVRG
jgi:hypothetical protein